MTAQSPSSVEQQFAAVVHAPLPFLLVCAVLAGFIWWAINWRYEAKIDRLTEERDRHKALNDRNAGAAKPVKSSSPTPPSQARNTGLRFEHGTVLGHKDDGTLRIASHGEDRPLALEDILNLMNSLEGRTSIKAMDLTRRVIGNPTVVTGKVIEVSEIIDKVSVSIALENGDGKDCYMLFENDHPRLLRLDKNQIVMVRGTIKSIDKDGVQLIDCYLIQ